MLIIGTAGHIDHGKSSIVKRLTDIDPDRLPEEKARGMTIDLGFAFYETENDESIGFVDVPGHERFVKNMIAGVGGIDIVMLVIAADDGWMPQSEEHFQIVRLLNIEHGFIVINKTDMVEPEWLELLEAEVTEHVAGSFLENQPIFKISAQTGAGFDQLNDYLNQLPKFVESKHNKQKTRLYIDRSFVRQGIGGVVTGTLRGGCLQTGQNVNIFPSLKEAKVRTLQSNNQEIQQVTPGQRTAVSLTGVEKDFLVRGGVISSHIDVEEIADNQHLALSVDLLNDSKIPLSDRRRLLLIIGTSEVEGEIRMYNNQMIKPGESGIIFFKPDEPLFSLIGDRYIMRLPTPMVTLGGGVILDQLNHFPRRKELSRYDYLNRRLPFNLENLLLSEIEKRGLVNKKNLCENSDFSSTEIDEAIKILLENKQISKFDNFLFIESYLQITLKNIISKIENYLNDKSHLKGLLLEQVVDITSYSLSEVKLYLKYLIHTEAISQHDELFNLAGRGMSIKGDVKQAYDKIINQLKAEPWAPPPLAKLATGGKNFKEAIRFIIESSEGYKCGTDFIFLTNTWEEVIVFVKEKLNAAGELKISDLKEKFGFSRKYAIPILEETDRLKITQRSDDVRLKGSNFEK